MPLLRLHARRPIQFGIGTLLCLTMLTGLLLSLFMADATAAAVLGMVCLVAVGRALLATRYTFVPMSTSDTVICFAESFLGLLAATIYTFVAVAVSIPVQFVAVYLLWPLLPFMPILLVPILSAAFGLAVFVHLLRTFWSPWPPP